MQQELERFKQHPALKYLFYGLSEENFYIWEEPVKHNNSANINMYGVIRIRRKVKFGLDRVALKMMYNEAVKQVCRFEKFDKDYKIPDELQSLANKILQAAKDYHTYPLTEPEKLLVLGHYVHCSAEYERYFYTKEAEVEVIEQTSGQLKKIKWRTLIEKEHAQLNLLKVHAPHINQKGDWQRQIHPN